MMTSTEIRTAFLKFFQSKGHKVVPSAPIVIRNDPTLMFTNAGMNQFKDYFLGNKQAPYPRVADTQKCLRVSGKHNDLEEVGVDTYHHTMFEMLGNWSFGDYFKKEAIEWSWELLTKVLKIPVDRLYVTIFEGDGKEGLPIDEEARKEWEKWIAPDRILPGNKKDNFWEMGDQGPCGPCTEIHVDTRPDQERALKDGKTLVNSDDPQVIEIWNNVFIQYNRMKDGSLQQLPAQHVDTGMGFERLVRVLQQKSSNYDTDVFSGTIQKIESITGQQYTRGDQKSDVAFRVLADHIRAISFTIADGQLPSNTGAGYVIRRILRRAVRYYYSYLDYKKPLLFQLVPEISEQFKMVFPELNKQNDFVAKVIREEENSFLKTIDSGLFRFGVYATDVSGLAHEGTDESYKEAYTIQSKYFAHRKQKRIAGEFAFELNDTFGFPIDLTNLLAQEKGWTVDMDGYNKALAEQKNRSRAATTTDTEDWVVVKEGTKVDFIGYDTLEAKANVLRYRKIKTKGKETFQLVLDKTPFYAESGGQLGDTGELKSKNSQAKIVDTKRENDLILHFVEQLPENLEEEFMVTVDAPKRKARAVHHTATHLLHAALRQVLGTHVAQKGSLVHEHYLRFDFSHFSKITAAEMEAIEKVVNEKIRQNIPVVIRQLPREDALKSGAMALFGEKYGDTVRVVTIDPSFSIELCGGTHAGATGELGFIRITTETAVAAGVRRIEAVSGSAAEDWIKNELNQWQQIKELLKNPPDPAKAIVALQEDLATLKKKIEKSEGAHLKNLRDELAGKVEQVNGVSFLGAMVAVPSADALKKLAFELKPLVPGHVMVLTAAIDGKAFVVLLFDETVAASRKLDAGATIKQKIAPLIKGGGGGQKTLATAGGQNTSDLQEVINTVKTLL